MKCIFCGAENNLTIEHIIPQAVGGRLKIDNVCKSCNSKLGSNVDSKLTDDLLFKILRVQYNRGNNGKNIIELTKNEHFKDKNDDEVIIKKGDGKNMPIYYDGTQTPDVDIHENNGEVKIKFKGSDIESITNALYKKAKKQNINISKAELKEKVLTEKNATWYDSIAIAPINFNNDKYIPCVIKIIYEMSFYIFGEKYLEDTRAKEIRYYLLNCMNNKPDEIDFGNADSVFQRDLLGSNHSCKLSYNPSNQCAYMSLILFGGISFNNILISYNAYNLDIENALKKINYKLDRL